LAAAALLLDAPQMLACVLLTMMMMMMMMQASRGAAASPTETVITLTGPKDFAGVSGAPLPTGFSAGASITSGAPFGMAIRSGIAGTEKPTAAALGTQLTPGVTVDTVSFSYRQCTGYATTGAGPTFNLSVAGSAAFESPPMAGFPYKKSCPGGACYSPAAQVSAKSLGIKVPADGVHRIAFNFKNTDQNLQLLLPMNLTLTCSGGPCTKAAPPPPAPNASAVTIACVGDSITQGYLSTNGATYPNQLQKMLGSAYKVVNFGAGGRTMLKKGDNPYWRTGPLKQALASKPAIVVLMLGTNDAKFGNWKGANIAQFPIDYKSMIDEFVALDTKPTVYLMVPPPLYQDGRYGMNQTVINTLFPGDGPAGVRTLAKASGLPAPIGKGNHSTNGSCQRADFSLLLFSSAPKTYLPRTAPRNQIFAVLF
jgi:lysophospholipase L1-like esterase